MPADPRTTWALQVSILELDLIAVLILIMARVIHVGVKLKFCFKACCKLKRTNSKAVFSSGVFTWR